MSAVPPATPGPVRLLAFDTSTERMAVAALHGGRRAVRNEAGGAMASARLLPVVKEVLAELGLDLRSLDAVAFGRGPGAFTGLRTSCAVAQGLAFGAGVPVLPVDSLLIVAEDAREQLDATDGLDIGVAMDARMDEVYAARFAWSSGCWRVTMAAGLFSLPALAEAWGGNPPPVLAGSALKAFGERLAWPAARRIEDEGDRAAALLRLAHAAWRAGEGVDAALALPLYLRDKVAMTTSEREALKAAQAATGVAG